MSKMRFDDDVVTVIGAGRSLGREHLDPVGTGDELALIPALFA